MKESLIHETVGRKGRAGEFHEGISFITEKLRWRRACEDGQRHIWSAILLLVKQDAILFYVP